MRIPAHVRWPAFIIGALAVHGAAWLVVVYLATSNPSYAVEDDYYAKALRWDDTREQDRVNAALGWRLELEVEPAATAGGEAVVRLALADRTGSAIAGAAVDLSAFHNSRAGDILRARLKPAGAGVYRAPLPMRRDGLWELRLVVDRGPDRFTHRETRHLRVAPARSSS